MFPSSFGGEAHSRTGPRGARLCCTLMMSTALTPSASAETVTYIHTDALGSVVAETDANGNVVKRYDYEPYGAVVGGQVADGHGYTGHVSDAATGLSYMQQRYYDPQLGLFLSVDPISTHSSTKHFNRYSYAYGNPYSFTDPDGRVPVMPFIYGAVPGGLADIAVQKAMNPDKPIDKVEAGIAAAVGSVSGGAGGVAVAAVGSGTISVGRAVAIQTVVNAVAGGAGSAAESAIKGQPITAEGVASNAIGSAAGGLAASGVGVAMGDFAGPAARGSLQRLSQSRGPVGRTWQVPLRQPELPFRAIGTPGAASQAGQGLAGAGATIVQKDTEKKNESLAERPHRHSASRCGLWRFLLRSSHVPQLPGRYAYGIAYLGLLRGDLPIPSSVSCAEAVVGKFASKAIGVPLP